MYHLCCKEFSSFSEAVEWANREFPSYASRIADVMPDDPGDMSEEDQLDVLTEIDNIINDEPYTRTYLCSSCDGSGEGRYDGAKCSVCNGSGSSDEYQQELDDIAEVAFDNDRD